MHNLFRIAAVLAIFLPSPVLSAEQIEAYMPGLKPVGSARMSVLMIDIYDATLFANEGAWKPGDPLALELKYHRNIRGAKIADRSVKEMRSIGISDEIKLAAWHNQMRKIFPDVSEGTTLTGVLTSGGDSIFFQDGQEIGRIKDADFGAAFFGIWLNEKTSQPQLRQKLLGAL